MSVELSAGNRCLQAFHQRGYDSEDEVVVCYAKLQRVAAYIFQCCGLSAAAAASVWGYNDPTRKNGAPVPLFVYITATSGGALWIAINTISLKRFPQNRDYKLSSCLDPLFAATIVSGSASTALGFAYLQAQEIANFNDKMNQEYNDATQGHQDQDDECYRDVYEKRGSFTNTDCMVCDLPGNFRRMFQFYQARPKEWFSQVVCMPTIDYKQDPWKSLHNVSLNSSESNWPCGDIYFSNIDNNTEYKILAYMSDTLRLYPPMEIVVSEINETCKLLNATGVEISMISSSLCTFHRPYETFCTNEAWKNYSTLYLENDLVTPDYQYYYQPDQVSRLLGGDSFNLQLALFGPLFLVSLLGIFGRIFVSRWHGASARTEQPLEMVTLNAEGSESEA